MVVKAIVNCVLPDCSFFTAFLHLVAPCGNGFSKTRPLLVWCTKWSQCGILYSLSHSCWVLEAYYSHSRGFIFTFILLILSPECLAVLIHEHLKVCLDASDHTANPAWPQLFCVIWHAEGDIDALPSICTESSKTWIGDVAASCQDGTGIKNVLLVSFTGTTL
jgi:hypothetical protein